jgi:hypothetical protein
MRDFIRFRFFPPASTASTRTPPALKRLPEDALHPSAMHKGPRRSHRNTTRALTPPAARYPLSQHPPPPHAHPDPPPPSVRLSPARAASHSRPVGDAAGSRRRASSSSTAVQAQRSTRAFQRPLPPRCTILLVRGTTTRSDSCSRPHVRGPGPPRHACRDVWRRDRSSITEPLDRSRRNRAPQCSLSHGIMSTPLSLAHYADAQGRDDAEKACSADKDRPQAAARLVSTRRAVCS